MLYNIKKQVSMGKIWSSLFR